MRAASGISAAVCALTAAGLLAGCGPSDPMRPAAKPDSLSAHATDKQGQLTRARVSTKSGEILILEPDGSLTQLALDSPAGRDAFALTEADLAALGVNLSLDLSHLPVPPGPSATPQRSAQQRALDEFAARSRPLLPQLRGTISEKSFLGAGVTRLDNGGQAAMAAGENGAAGLVAVNAELATGVDAETAFAYATCVMADWAGANEVSYARHVRSLSRRAAGRTRIDAVFTLTQGPRPMGLQVLEPEETLRACAQAGIPHA